jgi:hypothetical protein
MEREGPALWQALDADAGEASGPTGVAIGLLRAMVLLDQLGDVLAEWAVDRAGERPDNEVDAVTADVAQRLADLGVPHEDRARPPRA